MELDPGGFVELAELAEPLFPEPQPTAIMANGDVNNASITPFLIERSPIFSQRRRLIGKCKRTSGIDLYRARIQWLGRKSWT